MVLCKFEHIGSWSLASLLAGSGIHTGDLQAFYSKDVRLSNQNIESVVELVHMCDDAASLAQQRHNQLSFIAYCNIHVLSGLKIRMLCFSPE